MTDDLLTRLLDQAVPPVPERLRTAPLAAITRRARRRRAVVATASVCAVPALVAVIVLAFASIHDGAKPPPATDPTGSVPAPPASTATAVRWQFARVDRSERIVTVFANPAEGDCLELVNTGAEAAEHTDRVVLTVRGDTRPAADCARSGLAVPLRVTLSAPLDGRPIVDAATGQAPPAYLDRDLPLIPADRWQEVPGDVYRPTGDRFGISYTRAGGPDITIVISPAVGPRPSGPAGERRTLGRRDAVLAEYNQTWTVWWRSGGRDYVMSLVPSEGRALSRAEANAVLGQIDWLA
jgi:hypothetical protein